MDSKYFVISELRQPECSYDEDHCHAFCGTSQHGEAKGPVKKAVGTLDASAAEASSILQAIRLVSQVPSTRLVSQVVVVYCLKY